MKKSSINNRLQRFIKDVEKAIDAFQEYPTREAYILSHDDGDGLSAASILKQSLNRLGYKTSLMCIEKLYPQLSRSLHEKTGNLYFYTDIAAAHGRFLSELNKGRNLTVILDHHDAEPATDPKVYNLDPELYGISGETEVSGATTAYLFAKMLSQQNVDLAPIAVIGSAEIPGPLRGLNKIPLEDAVNRGLVEIRKTRGKEDYLILKLGKPISYKSYSSKLTILGSVGYYKGGPEKGVDACLSGFTSEIESLIGKFEEERKSANKKLLARLYREGLKKLNNVQWFHAEDMFQGMGVKLVGSFCSFIRFKGFVDPKKYLVGFMNMSPEIPGFGTMEGEYTKVSARVPIKLEKLIKSGERSPLSEILPAAAERVGGLGDGHSVAASGVFPRGREKEFIEEIDRLAGRYKDSIP